jgi:hypothetical protein
MLVALEINAMRGHRISRMVSTTFVHQILFDPLHSSSDRHHFPRSYLGI